MSDLLERVSRSINNNGPIGFLQEVSIHIKSNYYPKLVDVYWELNGGPQNMTCGYVEAKFGATSDKGGRVNRARFQSLETEIETILESLNCTDTFYDIGANTGLYSCFAAQKCSNGDVVASEPYEPNINQLRNNIEYNNLENIVIKPFVLSDKNGKEQIKVPKSEEVGFGGGQMSGDYATDGTKFIEVPAFEGDYLVSEKGVPQPNVVKIDVEGAEGLVIRGMKNILSNPDCRVVFCDVHLPTRNGNSIDDFGMTPEDVKEELQECGFELKEPKPSKIVARK